ncbi:MAG: sulfatase/phosphatase domain-containing protein, partial [Verrucomicrobiota bacterium]
PITREDWKRNYEVITAADAWAGDHLRALEEAGLAENTIVFIWSDHGVGLPRAKRWLYDSGTRIPFLVSIPEAYRTEGQGQPGHVSSELVSSVDFAPTVLNLLGLPIPEAMQGHAFLGEHLSTPRTYVYGARDRMDERYDIIRSVRDARYRYIRNFEPLKPYYQYMNTPEKGATMREIRKAAADGNPVPFDLPSKPLEELYDTQADPHEMENLAEDPEQAERLATMRTACLQWQFDIRDIGLLPESEIEIRESSIGPRYEILRQENTDAEATLQRLIEIAAKASEGETAMADLITALDHKDSAVRYWSATGLGNFPEFSIPAKDDLIAATTDKSPSVRIAAARALCRQGNVDQGLPILQEELAGDQEWARLQAAIALDELEEAARPALAELQAARENQPNKYIIRVANRAVNDLLGTEATVP